MVRVDEVLYNKTQKGADFAAFSETWLPGYPFFYPYSIHSPLWSQAVAAYLTNGVEIPSPTTDLLCKAARKANINEYLVNRLGFGLAVIGIVLMFSEYFV